MHDWHALVRARLSELQVDPARATDIVDELAQHVAQDYADLVARGVGDAEALARARAPLDRHKRLARELARADRPRRLAPPPPAEDGPPWSGMGRDGSYAVRQLGHAPGFAAAAVLILALGIGANAAIFSVMRAVLLAPLPYRDAARLVHVGEADAAGLPSNTGFATFVDWKAQAHAFEDLAVVRRWAPTLAVAGEPERLNAMRVTWNFFRMLGATPAIGRDFEPADDAPARSRVIVISDALWRRHFDGDPAVLERTVRLNDADYRIVGVLPPSFQPLISDYYYRRADAWAPLGYDVSMPSACRSCQHLKVIGRLAGNASASLAERDVNDVQARLVRQFPNDYATSARIAVAPLGEMLSGGIRPALTALMGAVAFVLLIACADVANLLLARVARRQRDLAMRAALGASRGRIVRQLLTESAVLAAAAGAVGLVLAAAAVPVLVHLAPASTPRLAAVRIDAAVVAFGIALSFATSAAFGLLAALHATRMDLSSALAGDTRRTAAAPTSAARRLLIGVDVALAVVLLAAAGLMIRSVGRLVGVNPGFDPAGVLTLQVSMLGANYAERDQVVQATDAILARIRALPGVIGAAAAGQIPLGGDGDTWGFHVDGRPASADDPAVERYSVTPDYFTVMRIPLKRGRLILDSDRTTSERVMVIGEQTARAVFPGADAIGQHVRIGGTDGPLYTIVGIAGDVRHQELAKPPTLQMYTSQWQLTDSMLTIVVRAAGDPARLTADVRRAIRTAAPDAPVYEIAPLPDLVAKSVGPRRFVMILLELFGIIALAMTTIGVYGLVAYSVAERTREIGVRTALGASPLAIVRLIVGGGSKIVLVGLAAGTIIAMIATRYLASSLFGVSATDPATYAAVIVVLFVVTLAAQLVPVTRAVRIDPAVALRNE